MDKSLDVKHSKDHSDSQKSKTKKTYIQFKKNKTKFQKLKHKSKTMKQKKKYQKYKWNIKNETRRNWKM